MSGNKPHPSIDSQHCTRVLRDQNLKPALKACYAVLATYAFNGTTCELDLETLAANLGVGEASAKRWLGDLRKAGYISWDRSRHQNAILCVLVEKRPEAPIANYVGEQTLAKAFDLLNEVNLLHARAGEQFALAARQFANETRGRPDETQQVLQFLYWDVPQMDTKDIANAFGIVVSELPHMTGPLQTEYRCYDCNSRLVADNREEWAQVTAAVGSSSTIAVCGACAAKRAFPSQAKDPFHQIPPQARLQMLKTMPYQEYLETPEWQTRRKEHLKRVSYRCQICNGGGRPLHVHHRTYDSRGEEPYEDLVALCADCHSLYHDSSKLTGRA